MVERDIALAAETGGWLHVTHLSTAAALAAVRRAKADGVRVTCDVTPHPLALTDAWPPVNASSPGTRPTTRTRRSTRPWPTTAPAV